MRIAKLLTSIPPFSTARARTSRVAAGVLLLAVVTALIVPATEPVAATDGLVTVSGTVTAPGTNGGNVGVAGTLVDLVPLRQSPYEAQGQIYQSYTNNDGTYEVNWVPPGSYRVLFDPTGAVAWSAYGSVWLGGSPYEYESEIITVSSAPITGLDMQLQVGGTVTGTVTFAGGASGTAAIQAFLIDPSSGRLESHGGVRTTVKGGAYTLRGLPPGEHVIRFSDAFYTSPTLSTQYNGGVELIGASTTVIIAGGDTVSGVNGTLRSVGNPAQEMDRIEGATRFDVSANVAGYYDPAATDVAFVVNGLNFPDALSAGPAAAKLGAPVLLVRPGSVATSVANALKRLSLDRIYVIGGTASVQPAVLDELRKYAPNVERIAGANRYEVSRNVATTFWPETRGAYIATGANFPDALAAGPAAALFGYPILLEKGLSTTVSAGTTAVIDELGISRLMIAGGPASFSKDLEASLTSVAGVPEVKRWSGTNRYSGAVEINNVFRAADTVYLATGSNFPDALAGAALAGATGSPLYLVDYWCVPTVVRFSLDSRFPSRVVVLGGEATLYANLDYLYPCD